MKRIADLLKTHPWIVDTLQRVLGRTSHRQASTGLHLHHFTLQDRLTWLGNQLGYDPTKPGGQQRAAVALLLWRLAHSETLNG